MTSYEYSIQEGIIPQNFSWRSGINAVDKTSLFSDPGKAMAQAFVQSLDRKPPKVELPPIQKSKQAQYWDAVLNNGVVWKTKNDDTRPDTQQELIAQQQPQQINEPFISDCLPNEFPISYTGTFVNDYDFQQMPINGLPNIHF